MSAPHESTGPDPTQITTAIPMRNKVLKLILMLALMLGIGACQTGPQTGKAGSGAISTLQQEDVLRAIKLEDEEFWEEAADAYLGLAKKYSSSVVSN